MARIRSIKPEWGASESLSAISVEAHLLSAALLTYADDEGYFKANPELVRAGTLPLRKLETPVSQLISELADIGYIELATGADGRRYGRIVNFLTHQKINRPTPSRLRPIAGFSDGSMRAQGEVTDGSGTGNREVEQGTGRGRRAAPADELPELPEELRTEAFRAALLDWLRYKRERGERYQPTGLQQQLAMLAKRGAEEATDALRLAMAQGWKGAAAPDAIDRFRRKGSFAVVGPTPFPLSARKDIALETLEKLPPQIQAAARAAIERAETDEQLLRAWRDTTGTLDYAGADSMQPIRRRTEAR